MSKANRIKINRQNAASSAEIAPTGMSPALKKALIILAVVVAVLGAAAILVLSALKKNGTLKRHADAIIVDGVTYKASDVDYYYNMYYRSLYNTAYTYSQYGLNVYNIDFTKSLFKQAYTTDSDDDGNPDYATWGDFVLHQAIESFTSYVYLENEAKAAGFLEQDGVSEQIDRSVQQAVASAKAEAEKNDVSFLTFLRFYYGETVTEESYEAATRRESIATYYGNSLYRGLEIEDRAVKEEYTDNAVNYDTVTYRTFSVTVDLPKHVDADGKEYSDDVTKEEDNKKLTEVTLAIKEAIADVKTEAEFEAAAAAVNRKDGDAETKTYSTLHENASYSSLQSSEQTQLFADDTKPGDTFVNTADNVVSVYFFISRETNHYPTRAFRHILLMSDEKDEAVAARAEELLARWKNEGATEEGFAALARENTEDVGSMLQGGLIEHNGTGSVVSEISDWLFADARKPGDTEIIFSDSYGYHVCYYVGEEDMEYWQVLADGTLRGDKYDELTEEIQNRHSYRVLDGMSRIK
ncbi:MAG: peptidylprolyl isomerase [Oscillospiraceae bacterium]|nr:peptidylprolyl isomerase [Oscillospiraceae bacterium]